MDNEVYFLLQSTNGFFVVATQPNRVREASVEYELTNLRVEVVRIYQSGFRLFVVIVIE